MPFSELAVRALLKSINDAASLPKIELAGDVLVISSGGAEIAADVLYVSALSAGLKVLRASPTEASVLVMPYRDFDRVIVFALDPKDSRAVRAATESALMGYNTVVVAPPLHETLESRLGMSNVQRVVVKSDSPLTTMSVASLLWAPKGNEARYKRLSGEVADIRTVPKWLEDNYRPQAEELVAAKSLSVYYTPSLRAGAMYLCRARRCLAAPLDALEPMQGSELTLLLATTAEEHDYKDIELRLASSGIRQVKVLFNTDPVTASAYSVFFAALALDLVM